MVTGPNINEYNVLYEDGMSCCDNSTNTMHVRSYIYICIVLCIYRYVQCQCIASVLLVYCHANNVSFCNLQCVQQRITSFRTVVGVNMDFNRTSTTTDLMRYKYFNEYAPLDPQQYNQLTVQSEK